MRKPYLIQRLSFVKDGNGSFDDVLRGDYMGSSEFEWGALPKSLKQLTRNFGSLKVNVFEDLHDYNDKPLCIIAEAEKANLYFFDYINELACDNIILKEQSRFKDNVFGETWNGKPIDEKAWSFVEAWWDIENHVLFTFGKENGGKILKTIGNTLAKKKSANESEWY